MVVLGVEEIACSGEERTSEGREVVRWRSGRDEGNGGKTDEIPSLLPCSAKKPKGIESGLEIENSAHVRTIVGAGGAASAAG